MFVVVKDSGQKIAESFGCSGAVVPATETRVYVVLNGMTVLMQNYVRVCSVGDGRSGRPTTVV